MTRLNAPVSGSGGGSESKKPLLILASGSPRRQELFSRFWGEDGFITRIPVYDERLALSDPAVLPVTPAKAAAILPAGKLQAMIAQYELPDTYLAIAADTLVVLNDQIMGKPENREEAGTMLEKLSGRRHEVMTGLALIVRVGGKTKSFTAHEVTRVRFAPLSARQIAWYLDTGEYADKAGAYGIQGYGSALIEAIDGCYYNVMGLPVFRLMTLLHEAAESMPSFHLISSVLPWNG